MLYVLNKKKIIQSNKYAIKTINRVNFVTYFQRKIDANVANNKVNITRNTWMRRAVVSLGSGKGENLIETSLLCRRTKVEV